MRYASGRTPGPKFTGRAELWLTLGLKRIADKMEKISTDIPSEVPFERVLVVVNPVSTHIRRARIMIAELRLLAGNWPIDIIETSAAGHAANVALLDSKASVLGPRTLICIAAGDGTINAIVEALVMGRKLSPEARQTPILPLWGGNANDLAWILNGPAGSASLSTILKHGKSVPILPMLVRMAFKGGSSQTYVAACTASFGATARVMQNINSARHRQSKLHRIPGGRFLKEASTGWGAAMKSPTFAVEEQGTSKNIYEYSYAKGSRMAKYYHLPVRLSDDCFYNDTIEGKRFFLTATALSLSFKRRLKNNALRKRMTFMLREGTWAQFDGESVMVKAGTSVTVELSKQPFYAVSTVLDEN